MPGTDGGIRRKRKDIYRVGRKKKNNDVQKRSSLFVGCYV